MGGPRSFLMSLRRRKVAKNRLGLPCASVAGWRRVEAHLKIEGLLILQSRNPGSPKVRSMKSSIRRGCKIVSGFDAAGAAARLVRRVYCLLWRFRVFLALHFNMPMEASVQLTGLWTNV